MWRELSPVASPPGRSPAFEREFKPDSEGKNIGHGNKIRKLYPRTDLTGGNPRFHLSGVAP